MSAACPAERGAQTSTPFVVSGNSTTVNAAGSSSQGQRRRVRLVRGTSVVRGISLDSLMTPPVRWNENVSHRPDVWPNRHRSALIVASEAGLISRSQPRSVIPEPPNSRRPCTSALMGCRISLTKRRVQACHQLPGPWRRSVRVPPHGQVAHHGISSASGRCPRSITRCVSTSHRINDTGVMDDVVRLRPVEESDLALLLGGEWNPDVAGELQWFGFRMDQVRKLERRWHDDGLIGEQSSYLAVIVGEDTCAGYVDWRPSGRERRLPDWRAPLPRAPRAGDRDRSATPTRCLPLATTTAHRIQAGTEVDNVAEQRALEKVGFQRQGTIRGVVFRVGRWRDGLMYGLLCGDVRP